MATYTITSLMKVRDCIEADDLTMAMMLFKAKYPACLDRDSMILNIKHMNELIIPTFQNKPE